MGLNSYRVMKKHMFERDEKKKRDLVKKVIAYMTLGNKFVNFCSF